MKILFHRNFKVSTFKLDLGSNFTPLFAAICFSKFRSSYDRLPSRVISHRG